MRAADVSFYLLRSTRASRRECAEHERQLSEAQERQDARLVDVRRIGESPLTEKPSRPQADLHKPANDDQDAVEEVQGDARARAAERQDDAGADLPRDPGVDDEEHGPEERAQAA